MSGIDRDLIAARLQIERDRGAERKATPEQLPLDLGNLLYSDGQPELHGTQVGVSRHAAADEDLCPQCQLYVEELATAGLAVRTGPAPEIAAARQLNGNRIPRHSPYQLHDWVQLHGYPGAMPGPRQHGFRGYSPGSMAPRS